MHSLWPQMGPLKRYLNILTLSFLFPEMGPVSLALQEAARISSAQSSLVLEEWKRKLIRESRVYWCVFSGGANRHFTAHADASKLGF